MSEVKLLDIEEIEHEVFTRWDITGHQVNRHLLSRALTGTEGVVLDQMTFPPGFVHHMHFFTGVGAVDDIGYEAYKKQGQAAPSIGGGQ
jgi:hypothetical protein